MCVCVEESCVKMRVYVCVWHVWIEVKLRRFIIISEGSLEVKLPTMDRWKAEQGRGREKDLKREDQRRERFRRKKMQMRKKAEFWKLRCRKSVCRWREAHFEVKMYKTHPCSDHCWKLRCRKSHAVVARSTFRSQNVQNTPCSDNFLEVATKKCSCGAKHISKSKCTKDRMFAPLLEV